MNPADANINQQWQQARELLSAGKMPESVSYLEAAAAGQHAAASFNLGCLHLFRLLDTADKSRGIDLIRQAAELEHDGALYQLAMIELGTANKEPNWQYADECLKKSAELGHPVALRSLAILWSRSADESLLRLGTLCLEHAAQSGDLVSLALLMQRLRGGIGCIQNILRANAINTLLMDTNLPVEPPMSTAHPDFAQPHQLANLPELPMPDLATAFWKAPFETVSESPWVAIADNVLNSEECCLVRYLGGPHLEPSFAADPDGKLVKVHLRSSFDMTFSEMQEDIIMLLIQMRMAAIANTTPAYSEPLQLLRYQNGQEYRPHRDYLPASLINPLEQGGAGQRNSTVIVYLNDVESGGETEFIELNKKIAPRTGRVLAFGNLHADGSPDPRTLHAGLPVTFGTKWIATMWIHQGVFRS